MTDSHQTLKNTKNIFQKHFTPKQTDHKASSLITDADLVKEAKPIDCITHMLPLLLRNGVVHFLGFENRLGFDPLPSKLQVIIKLPTKV
jgi:hypothetical protein